MAHQIAKLLLEKAGTFLERTEAVRTALSLGMPLREIEDYLDWLDNARWNVAENSVKEARAEPANRPTERPADAISKPSPPAVPLPPALHEAGHRGPVPR